MTHARAKRGGKQEPEEEVAESKTGLFSGLFGGSKPHTLYYTKFIEVTCNSLAGKNCKENLEECLKNLEDGTN